MTSDVSTMVPSDRDDEDDDDDDDETDAAATMLRMVSSGSLASKAACVPVAPVGTASLNDPRTSSGFITSSGRLKLGAATLTGSPRDATVGG